MSTNGLLKSQYSLCLFFCIVLVLFLNADPRSLLLSTIFLITYILISASSTSQIISKSFVLTLVPLIAGGFFPNTLWYVPWIFYFSTLTTIFYLMKSNFKLKKERINDANLVATVTLILIVVSNQISKVDSWAWQLRGDAINFIVSIRSLNQGSSLFNSIFLPNIDYGLPPGSSFSIQWISQMLLNMTGGSSGDISDLATSFLGINLLAWIAISVSVLERMKNSKFKSKAFTSVVLSILLLSWINGGLTMYNGFLSVPLTITLLYLSLLDAITKKESWGFIGYIVIQIFLGIVLFSTWSIVAITSISIVFASSIEEFFTTRADHTVQKTSLPPLSRKLKKALLRFWILMIFFVSYSLVLFFPSFSSVLLRSGAFPNVPIATLFTGCVILILFFCICISKVHGNFFYPITMVAITLLSLSNFFHHMNPGSVLRGLRSEWVTETYYLQKATWVMIVSFFFVLVALVNRSKYYFVILSILAALVTIETTNANGVWSSSERSLVSYTAIHEIDNLTKNDRVMYFNFDNWLGDAYLISLAGLQFESYSGHPVGKLEYVTTTFMPSNSFAGRNFYTDERNALCVGQSFIGVGGEIRTRDKELGSKLQNWCGNGPFPKVKVYA